MAEKGKDKKTLFDDKEKKEEIQKEEVKPKYSTLADLLSKHGYEPHNNYFLVNPKNNIILYEMNIKNKKGEIDAEKVANIKNVLEPLGIDVKGIEQYPIAYMDINLKNIENMPDSLRYLIEHPVEKTIKQTEGSIPTPAVSLETIIFGLGTYHKIHGPEPVRVIGALFGGGFITYFVNLMGSYFKARSNKARIESSKKNIKENEGRIYVGEKAIYKILKPIEKNKDKTEINKYFSLGGEKW